MEAGARWYEPTRSSRVTESGEYRIVKEHHSVAQCSLKPAPTNSVLSPSYVAQEHVFHYNIPIDCVFPN